jgi:hypothetical protein
MAFLWNCSASTLRLTTLGNGDTAHVCTAIAASPLVKHFQRPRHVQRTAHNRRHPKHRAAAPCAARSHRLARLRGSVRRNVTRQRIQIPENDRPRLDSWVWKQKHGRRVWDSIGEEYWLCKICHCCRSPNKHWFKSFKSTTRRGTKDRRITSDGCHVKICNVREKESKRSLGDVRARGTVARVPGVDVSIFRVGWRVPARGLLVFPRKEYRPRCRPAPDLADWQTFLKASALPSVVVGAANWQHHPRHRCVRKIIDQAGCWAFLLTCDHLISAGDIVHYHCKYYLHCVQGEVTGL